MDGTLVYGRGWTARVLAGVFLVAVAAVAAVGLEFTQVFFVGRTVSQNDIAAESAGGVLGVLGWLAMGERVVLWIGRYRSDTAPRSQLIWLLQAYTIGFVIFSVIPLDLTISLTELYDKYERGMVLLVPFMYRYESLDRVVYQVFADVATFVPVGAWLVVGGWHRALATSPWTGVVMGGVLFSSALEFVQLLVVSRFTDATDVLLGTLGVVAGASVAMRTERTAAAVPHSVESTMLRAMPWLVALVLYSMFLAMGFLFPFEITRDRELIHTRWVGFFRAAFLALYLGSEFNAIKQLLVRVLLFGPIGIIWSVIAHLPRRRVVRWCLLFAGGAYSVALASGIEVAQVLMPAKIADATEVALCSAGALGGLAVSWRVLRARESRAH